MNELPKLPKLKKVSGSFKKKPKILLLSDDLRLHSGIATMSREFVIGTAHRYDWVQLGAALHHPDHLKVFDISDDVNKHAGIDDADVKIYAHTGYGNKNILRELLEIEKPDAILHFTDPRFWTWLYLMEYEIHQKYKIPLMYYNIWDSPPAPFWNYPYYKSCDLIMNISKQTNALVKIVLGENNYHDIQTGEGDGDILLSYVPHGINSKIFRPITNDDADYSKYIDLKKRIKDDNGIDFMIFWNNRNIRRKMPGDLILAYKTFCDMLPKDKAKRVLLFMKTSIIDDNGTNLPEVVRVICPDYKVMFNEERLPSDILNIFYNISDVTVNIASNEGFGLSCAESIMAGTPVLNNVTGGLQDQVRFEDDDGNWIEFNKTFTSNHFGKYTVHGKWAKVVFPSNNSLQGSPATPYIFDDRCDYRDVAQKLYEWYNTAPDIRARYGLEGRNWLLGESGMNAAEMSKRFINAIDKCLNEFQSRDRFKIVKVNKRKKIQYNGIAI